MLKIGQLVDNKYRILDVVGQGGMSVVYLARNERANKSWAIKEVKKVGEENLEVKKNSLVAETEMLKKLSHPNLPTIVDVIETEDTYLVVMDYIEGNDLNEILKEFGAQPQEKVIEWGKQLCDVLEYLHTREKPIIYRDLKPANIMLKPDGNIMLIDFGTAREIKIADANDTISLGTRGYAAPEQFGTNAKTDARTDIYCLGATLYHLVTNHNPSTEPYVILPIRQHNPTLSVGLENIIIKCTQSNPELRYQSGAELMYALEHYDTLDGKYRKKQKRKLGVFFTSVAMIFLSLCVSLFGYINAENKKTQDINECIKIAKNEEVGKPERELQYQNAIKLAPDNEEYYNDLISLYRIYGDNSKSENENEDRWLSKLELQSFEEQLEDEIEQFKVLNPEGYQEFCKNMGLNCWYCYENEKDSKKKAKDWFDRYIESVGENNDGDKDLVNAFIKIVECENKDTIGRLGGEENKYIDLWNTLKELDGICQGIEGSKEVIGNYEEIAYGYKEIISEIKENCADFSKVASIKESHLKEMVTRAKSSILKIYKNKKDSKTGEEIKRLFTVQNDSSSTIENYFEDVIKQIENNYKNVQSKEVE